MRRYRMTPNGEKPVWASRKKIAESGRREGERAYWENREPIHYGNPIFDEAAREAYEELKQAKGP